MAIIGTSLIIATGAQLWNRLGINPQKLITPTPTEAPTKNDEKKETEPDDLIKPGRRIKYIPSDATPNTTPSNDGR